MEIIGNELNFFSKRNNSSLLKYSKCLENYSKNFKKEISLKTSTPIFLDTNILLRYYSISFTARKKLFDFIKSNKNRIVLSSQVQFEFIKNREDVIQKFFEQVTNKIPKDFNNDVVNKMKSFLETHKIVLKDYPFMETGIEEHKKDLEELLKKLNETADSKKKENIDLIVKDEFLDLLNTCTFSEELTTSELELVKKDFDILKKNISIETIDSVLNKTNSIFPGLGDIKNKPDDPYGDYIIFHEMMKHIVINKTDIIFLTFDNSKGDWMSKSKTPYLHYVQNMYLSTDQIIYIFDAERILEEILDVNIQSLVSTDQIAASIDINIQSLVKLSKAHPISANARPGLFGPNFIKELMLAGYSTINELSSDLDKSIVALERFENKNINSIDFNSIGKIKTALRIANPNYIKMVNREGVVMDINSIEYEKFRKFLTS